MTSSLYLLPDTLDSLHYPGPNHSIKDAIAHLHSAALSHLDSRKSNYVKILFVDYSSSFNGIIPLYSPISCWSQDRSQIICQCISNFLIYRSQTVQLGKHASSSLTLGTGAPKGCVLRPLPYSLYTYDCMATYNSTTIIKFANDTVKVGLISDDNEMAYTDEITNLEI